MSTGSGLSAFVSETSASLRTVVLAEAVAATGTFPRAPVASAVFATVPSVSGALTTSVIVAELLADPARWRLPRLQETVRVVAS